MHELSLCRSLIKQLEMQAQQQGFSRVHEIWLEVGPMSAVMPESLEFAFSACSRGTLADGATLHIVEQPARARCGVCGEICTVSSRFDPCPNCAAEGLALLSGDGVAIKELEVE